MNKDIKLRDKRNKGWFYLDNEYLNGLGRHLGPIGIAVYVSLCRHADGGQKCFPSQQLIAEEIGASERSVRDYLKKLEEHNVIVLGKERSADGKWLNNVYYLTDKTQWKYPEAMVADGYPEANDDTAIGNRRPSHRQEVPTNNTNKNNTNKKKTNIVVPDNEWVFSLEEMKKNKRKDIQIIATYWQLKGFSFENKKQYEAALKRELRPAGVLVGYSIERIEEVINYLKGLDFKFTLETVHKYIDEPISNSSGVIDLAEMAVKKYGAKDKEDLKKNWLKYKKQYENKN